MDEDELHRGRWGGQQGNGEVPEGMQPNVIFEGLKLRLESQGHNTPLRSYSYASVPGKNQSHPVRWHYLVTEDEGRESICIYELIEGQGLADLKTFNNCYTKAVILINTAENYELAREFMTGVRDVPVPLFVVKKSDGRDILRCLESHIEDFVFVMVDAASEVPDPKVQPSGIGRFANFVRNAFSGQSKEVVELMAEVQRLMFTPANAPVHVSADKAVFFNLMFAFHNYATTANRGDISIGVVMKKLKDQNIQV